MTGLYGSEATTPEPKDAGEGKRSASPSRAIEGPAKRQPETKDVPKILSEAVPKTVQTWDVPKKSRSGKHDADQKDAR